MPSRSRVFQLGIDGAIVFIALAFAYLLRFEGLPPRLFIKQFVIVVPYLILLRVGLFFLFGVYRLVWRYLGLHDLPRIAFSLGVGTLTLILLRLGLPIILPALGIVYNTSFSVIPYGVLLIELILSFFGIVGVRLLWRTIQERAAANAPVNRVKERVFVIGAGSAGVMVAKEAIANPDVGFQIVGFIDDDKRKHGTILQGFRVLGATLDLERLTEKHDVSLVIIAIASASSHQIRDIVNRAEKAELSVKIIPGLSEILSGRVAISKIRNVAIEDLLGRTPVQLDEENLSQFIKDRVILVTGAGGSIGSEICRQVLRFGPSKLVALDQAEGPIFNLLREYQDDTLFSKIKPIIGSVTDRSLINDILSLYKPAVIYHAAAHKHVPLMEENPQAAIKNNVLGTRSLADAADQAGVEAFVMISTDKAVNPSSVMGASKRLAEMYVQSLATKSDTRFITVRFGNVLGSQGSVIPVFKEQIAKGGPITITDERMKRYFMTIPEASQLVLQSSAMGEGGEIFILEMGEPVYIVNLAKDLIRLSGYNEDDIEIVFTGMRPGEKLYEEINLTSENADKTRHPRIWIGKYQQLSYDDALQTIEHLAHIVDNSTISQLKEALERVIPEYRNIKNEKDAILREANVLTSTSC